MLPGVIDSQVHFREPGMTHKEDLESGSRSAVMGGVTAVFEMPNTDPLTIDDAAFADKIGRAIGRMHCDFAFFIGGTADNSGQVAEYEQLPGCAGIKVFMGSSTGKLLIPDDAGLRARTGVTIIAILRDPEPVSGAQPEDRIQRGDTLVAVGKAGQFGHFRRLLAEGPFDSDS